MAEIVAVACFVENPVVEGLALCYFAVLVDPDFANFYLYFRCFDYFCFVDFFLMNCGLLRMNSRYAP